MDNETKLTMLWLAENLYRLLQGGRHMTFTCVCNHGIEHHYDDQEGCQFPQTIGAPFALCECRQFSEPT